jgi:hypothetical protein
MKRAAFVCAAVLLYAYGAFAFESSQRTCSIPKNFEDLKAKASETAEIKLDANQLKLAGSFLNGKANNEAMIQKLTANLRNICVLSFTFDQAEKYSKGEVEDMRRQFNSPEWSKMITFEKQKRETVDVYMRMKNDTLDGLAVIVAVPKQLSFIQIDGPIDIQQLLQLGGNFGIPILKNMMPAGSRPQK